MFGCGGQTKLTVLLEFYGPGNRLDKALVDSGHRGLDVAFALDALKLSLDGRKSVLHYHMAF